MSSIDVLDIRDVLCALESIHTATSSVEWLTLYQSRARRPLWNGYRERSASSGPKYWRHRCALTARAYFISGEPAPARSYIHTYRWRIDSLDQRRQVMRYFRIIVIQSTFAWMRWWYKM